MPTSSMANQQKRARAAQRPVCQPSRTRSEALRVLWCKHPRHVSPCLQGLVGAAGHGTAAGQTFSCRNFHTRIRVTQLRSFGCTFVDEKKKKDFTSNCNGASYYGSVKFEQRQTPAGIFRGYPHALPSSLSVPPSALLWLYKRKSTRSRSCTCF